MVKDHPHWSEKNHSYQDITFMTSAHKYQNQCRVTIYYIFRKSIIQITFFHKCCSFRSHKSMRPSLARYWCVGKQLRFINETQSEANRMSKISIPRKLNNSFWLLNIWILISKCFQAADTRPECYCVRRKLLQSLFIFWWLHI